MKWVGFLRSLVFLAVVTSGSCAPPPEAIRFSILSTESSAATRPDWTPFLNDMRTALGQQVEAYFGPNYSVLIEAMRFKQTQLGWFGNASALEAVERSDGEVFAIAERGGYFSHMIARTDRNISLSKVIACDGRFDFAASDPQSTSGTLSPNAYLWGPNNLDPMRCFKTSKTANHEANILAVSNGLVDVAIVDSSVLSRVAARAPEATKNLTVIWTSPRLPDDPMVWRRDLDPALKSKIRAFVTTYGQAPGSVGEQQRAVLSKLGLKKFTIADNRHLAATKELKAWSKLIDAKRRASTAEIAAAQAEISQARASLP
jgi:phosphonate transport system substrate-binding protein